MVSLFRDGCHDLCEIEETIGADDLADASAVVAGIDGRFGLQVARYLRPS